MVWPPSAPSQMCMGRGARDQETSVCCEHVRNAGVRPLSDSGLGVAGSGCRLSALFYGEKKSTGVRPPSAPSRKWSGRGTWSEPLVLLTGRNVVIVLYSKSWLECYRRSLLACMCLVVSPLRCCRVLPMAVRVCACPSSTSPVAELDLRPAASSPIFASRGTCVKSIGSEPIGVA